ncbi:MAG: hypothetical protein WC254_00715 [Candidatus Woesearchaeota archaeon]|jgi:hypothetical protein
MNRKKLHEYHTKTLFLLFLFVAMLGLSVLVLQGWFQDVTGAVTATAEYTACTDYGNYIILSNDAGWNRVKKDICTGVGNQYIRKAACVLREETIEHNEYTFVYTKVAYCEDINGVRGSCMVDSNNAAYCLE